MSRADFWTAVAEAAAAREDGSNDDELDALWTAVEYACHLLGDPERLTSILDAAEASA